MKKQILIPNLIKESIIILLGIFIAGFGLKSFLIPNGFIDGGVTGISLIISFITPLSISLLIFILNIPFMILARKQVGNIFAIKTCLAILILALCLIFIEYPVVTSDKLLVAVFGGFLVGGGVGLVMRGGGVLDGTEVLSVYLNKKIGLSIGEIIFGINIIIFSFAALLLGIESALYSVLTYLAASKTVDFFIQGVEEYIGMTIISNKSEEIRKKLINDLKKGVTIYRGKKGFLDSSNKEIDILFTFLTRLETTKIKQEIISIDPNAVIIEEGIKDVKGGIIKKRPLH
ncbi:MAG TPA: YitT family protein [Candidatus Paceibacterota bacterium]|nr:YitT family protein [Candidatus Paceibacterota bacterium]